MNRIEKEHAILVAADRLIREQGILHVKMTEVAKEANIHRSRIYDYYRDLSEVLACLCMDELQAGAEAVSEERFEGYYAFVMRDAIYPFLTKAHQTALKGSLLGFLAELDEMENGMAERVRIGYRAILAGMQSGPKRG
ncbi:TetR/AcrR family transcriptional regulator [Marinobacter hydrocarbonoclasticus]|nr:TetR/AcrR family transcriptional regulator [Marinobacter nauticus]